MGVPTEGKTFGDVFDESELTDDIRERYTNKYFPSDYGDTKTYLVGLDLKSNLMLG